MPTDSMAEANNIAYTLDYDYKTKDFLVVDYAYLDETIFNSDNFVDSKLPTLALSTDNPVLACLYLTTSEIFNSYVQENTKNKDSLLVTDSLALGHIHWQQHQLSPHHNTNTASYAPTLLASDSFSAVLTTDIFKGNVPKCKGVQMKKKYKPVALKVKPVAGTVPEDFHVERNIKGDPLANMPPLDPNPPPFIPTGRFTEERKNQFLKEHDTDLVAKQNQAFAWEVEEKGYFKPEYFP
ncbi:hypothetical protein C0995_010346 [Termitomyces sp. Mi166|nr:hypothetical protein C0995_010346 [Termitomyces sp. Mi166\